MQDLKSNSGLLTTKHRLQVMEDRERDQDGTYQQMLDIDIKLEPDTADDDGKAVADVLATTVPSKASNPLLEQSTHLMKHGLLQAIIDQGYLARSQHQQNGPQAQAGMLTLELWTFPQIFLGLIAS